MNDKFEKRKKDIDNMFSQIETGVKEVFESEKYKKYLTTMSKFHQYSFRNSLLIALQNPNATVVAGYGSWKKKFNRQVLKGEKGIQILGYTPRKITKEQELTDKNGHTVYDLNGEAKKEKITKEIPSFTPVYVFDVSQTEGEPLPELINELNGSIENYNSLFEALKEVSPFPVEFENIAGGSKGYCDPVNKKIAIKEGMSEVQTIKTLIHEITHADLHAPELNLNFNEQTDTRSREIEAESTAFVVSSHYGIDTSDYSFGYLASWSSSKELDELQNSLGKIQEQANNLIERIDSRLEELQLEKTNTIAIENTDIKLEIKEPTILIEWSENANFKENEIDTLFNMNNRLKIVDNELKYDLGYDKTKYTLNYYLDGAEHQYTGRIDLGDGIGGVVENIKSHWEFELNNPIFPKTAEEIKSVQYMINEFVPYLENHLAISELEEKYKDQNILKSVESEYIDKISEWVDRAREANNTGSELPKLPERIDTYTLEGVPVIENIHERIEKFDIERKFTIYQLPHTDENRNIIFENFERLEKQGVNPSFNSYKKIYEADLPAKSNLNDIFIEFNTNLPMDYTGRSLSVSDIVVIETNKKTEAYYIDSFGFQNLPSFAIDHDLDNKKEVDLLNVVEKTKQSQNEVFRYYSTQRPVSLGTYPKSNNVVDIVNYNERIEKDDTLAWGYIDYKEPLTQDLVNSYELKADPSIARRIRERLDTIVFDGEIDLDKERDSKRNIQTKLTPMNERFTNAKAEAIKRNGINQEKQQNLKEQEHNL